MMDRRLEISEFLARSGWSGASRNAIDGDASTRCYERIALPGNGGSAVLMDAPVSTCGSQDDFVKITGYLHQLGLSAPRLIAHDLKRGLLLLEDFGDSQVARVLEQKPHIEARVYRFAIDLLAELRNHVPPDLPEYTPQLQAEVALRTLDWYRPGVTGVNTPNEIRSTLRNIVADLVNDLGGRKFFVHRDFHAGNLVWLPKRPGLRKLGLLDYQDAKLAHPAYDLASLLEDARRDLTPGLRREMLKRYAELTGAEIGALKREAAVSGAQRNLGILGVFARLAMRDGKRAYVGLIGRVWNNLSVNLLHPHLSELATFVDCHVPRPVPAALERILSWRG